MLATIHQPEHLPWLGWFDKARRSDLFILLDQVQYRKNYFQNRNRIRADRGSQWVTVPVLTKGTGPQPIREVRIDNQGNPRWIDKYWRSLVQNYQKSPYWTYVAPVLEPVYQHAWTWLAELNEALIRSMSGLFGIEIQLIRSSDLKVKGSRSELLCGLCQKVGATTYLSGISGQDYLDRSLFDRAKINIVFQNFRHPIYRQMHEPFVPALSAIDLLFNYGPESRSMLAGEGVPALDQVFR